MQYVRGGRKKMQRRPRRGEALEREMSRQSQIKGNISHSLCLLCTKESNLWTQMNKGPGCNGLPLLELFDSFSPPSQESHVHLCTTSYLKNNPLISQKEIFFKFACLVPSRELFKSQVSAISDQQIF